jgi:cellulose synthase/poly-beta-1,6-N-acetylglucosamine synthase-like glycosyltransferase
MEDWLFSGDMVYIAIGVFLATYVISLSVDFGRAVVEAFFNFMYKKNKAAEALSKDEVAFVIPCCNSADVIEDTIKSLPTGYSVFCVVNGCTDFTQEVVEKIAKTNPLVHVVISPLKGKIRSVLYGAAEAKKKGCSHFVLLDDDVQWPADEKNVLVHSKETPITALPVVPTKAANWLHAAQIIEYKMMVVSKRAQSFLGNVIMVSGAAGVYKINTFLEAMKNHDGEHIGDDLQCSYIHHCMNMKIDLYPGTVIRTEPPQTISAWWKQRAKRWEVSPIHNLVWILKTIFASPVNGPGWWIRLIAGYRVFVSLNDLARVLSFPLVLLNAPLLIAGVWGITYASMLMKVVTYNKFYSKFVVKWDKTMWLTTLTYPLYGSLMWLSRLCALPKGLYQIWLYRVCGRRKDALLKPLVEELTAI